MSNPEEMLVQLINSINKLSNLVQNVNEAITKLSTQITQLDTKMIGFSNVESQVSEVGLKVGDIPNMKGMIADLASKIDGLSNSVVAAPAKKSGKKKEYAAPAEVKEPEKPKEEYVSPALEEKDPSFDASNGADAAFNAVSSKFKHISQMITPQSSCGNIGKMLEDLRAEVETQVGMSPMLYELNSWVKRVGKMPEGDILLPDIHSELISKLDDWLERVTKAIHLKYQ